MARQVGPVFATGTIDGIIFYKLGDHYYMRSKGDYKCAKMMRRDPRLQRTMQKADQFGQASNITKDVYYRHLPKALRKYGLFGQLTGKANSWLQQGKSHEEVKELLLAYCKTLTPPANETEAASAVTSTIAEEKAQATPIVKTAAPVAQPQPSSKTRDVTQKGGEPIAPRVKQARYLSNWKVKRNGCLDLPIGSPHGLFPACTNEESRNAAYI